MGVTLAVRASRSTSPADPPGPRDREHPAASHAHPTPKTPAKATATIPRQAAQGETPMTTSSQLVDWA